MSVFKKLLLSWTVASLMLFSLGTNLAVAQDAASTPSSVSFTNADGVLELLSIPDPFIFGEHSVTTEEVVETLIGELNVVLSDFRPLTENNGWNLSADLSRFTFEGVETLDGATLDFSNIAFTKLNTSIDSTDPNVGTTNLVSGGDSINLVYANRTVAEDSLDGIGPWEITGDVTLTIPEYQSSVGDHSATLTWTLTDAY